MKKRLKYFVLTLLGSAFIIYVVHYTIFDNLYTFKSLSDAIFVVALIMFFVSLVTLTEAEKMFRIAVYSFRSAASTFGSLFRYKFTKREATPRHRTYYDYAKDKENEKILPFALEMMIISVIYIAIAFYLSQRYFDTL